jgi:SAM-dependent methyltransferase
MLAGAPWPLNRGPRSRAHLGFTQRSYHVRYGESEMADPRGVSTAPPPGVIADISPEDVMYKTAPAHYFWWGMSAMWCIRVALHVAQRGDPGRILDFACGHGRVLRMIRAEWSRADITAVDVDASGAEFCARTFGATAVVANSDTPADTPLDGQFDLIWCGSLLTHVDYPRWNDFLDLFKNALAREGVLVFTTHGDRFLEVYRKGTMRVHVPRFPELSSRYDRDGFSYCDYPAQPGYGISLSAVPWVIETVDRRGGLRHLLSAPAAWGGLQDLHAYTTPLG